MDRWAEPSTAAFEAILRDWFAQRRCGSGGIANKIIPEAERGTALLDLNGEARAAYL
jgi:hypothetical protein